MKLISTSNINEKSSKIFPKIKFKYLKIHIIISHQVKHFITFFQQLIDLKTQWNPKHNLKNSNKKIQKIQIKLFKTLKILSHL